MMAMPIPSMIDADIHPVPTGPGWRSACLTDKCRLRTYEVTLENYHIIVMV
jgi:hypothetical protein